MAEEMEIENEAPAEASPAPPAIYALVVRGFVSAKVYDPENYTDPVFTILGSEDAGAMDDVNIGDRWTGSEFVAPVILRQAVVVDGVVINVENAPEGFIHEDEARVYIPSETAQTGDAYEDGEFTPAPPIPIARADVDAERDRRTVEEFFFQNKPYRLDEKSISRITAMGADARFAVLGGAQEGNLRWADPNIDFGFIASDNTITPMDAQTVVAFSNAAKLWVSRLTFKGLALKTMQPIPQDFTKDSYWSAE